eukprot:gb/GECG01008679.1/.p1 GENE.gb/GECG01008679.1/~~gb/GECG01008679.1/.p1  ORF type:complete len:304 (+),score=34.11 gb/GECG01008679.1/:1-912(+)
MGQPAAAEPGRCLVIAVAVYSLILTGSFAAGEKDLGDDIKEGLYDDFIRYDANTSTYHIVQPFTWSTSPFDSNDYITLKSYERFNGSDFEIDLGGIDQWIGLLDVGDSVSSFAEAPIIHNVRTVHGSTGEAGAFILRPRSKFAKVYECSNEEGEIGPASFAGGICGEHCGSDGEVLLTKCYTTGEITSTSAGGICGNECGKGGVVNIVSSCSLGDIHGSSAGGVCGAFCGTAGGVVTMLESYSRGEIGDGHDIQNGGGICGGGCGTGGFCFDSWMLHNWNHKRVRGRRHLWGTLWKPRESKHT